MPTAVPAPGSPTVPPLAGWEGLVVVLLAVLVVAVGFLLVGALATGRRRRSAEWQAWLAGRSRSRPGAGEQPAPADRVAEASDRGTSRPDRHPRR